MRLSLTVVHVAEVRALLQVIFQSLDMLKEGGLWANEAVSVPGYA